MCTSGRKQDNHANKVCKNNKDFNTVFQALKTPRFLSAYKIRICRE